MKIKTLILSFFILGAVQVYGQNNDEDLVQLSGAVLLADSTNPKPIPFAHILNTNRSEGTITNGEGFFSLVVAEGDTILFSAVGLKNNIFIVPSPLDDNDYTLIQFMDEDTVMLETINLSPWPSKEEFNRAFVNLELPTDDLMRARQNITQTAIRQLSSNIPMDANMNFKNTLNQYNSYMYNQGMYYGNNGGQAVLNALTNPFAWSSFIKSLKNR